MAKVEIRDLPDWVLHSFQGTAESAGHSLEEELRCVLTEVAAQRRTALLAEIDALHEMFRKEYGELPDSTPEIRADREARG